MPCPNSPPTLTNAVPVGVLNEAHGAAGFGVTPERALCVHTVKAEPAVISPLGTLVNVCGQRDTHE